MSEITRRMMASFIIALCLIGFAPGASALEVPERDAEDESLLAQEPSRTMGREDFEPIGSSDENPFGEGIPTGAICGYWLNALVLAYSTDGYNLWFLDLLDGNTYRVGSGWIDLYDIEGMFTPGCFLVTPQNFVGYAGVMAATYCDVECFSEG